MSNAIEACQTQYQHAHNQDQIDAVPITQENILFGDHLVQDLEWLIDELKKHQSIDTLAKKLFLDKKRHSQLFKLKCS